ncbi:hypothetical protein BJ166DRAFT_529185 [Pestalotiopsis sp. NC0098]|nr:hypothetical protein BJ166DRAFT_529185 [Pestalotiopsis sp. NC0098]
MLARPGGWVKYFPSVRGNPWIDIWSSSTPSQPHPLTIFIFLPSSPSHQRLAVGGALCARGEDRTAYYTNVSTVAGSVTTSPSRQESVSNTKHRLPSLLFFFFFFFFFFSHRPLLLQLTTIAHYSHYHHTYITYILPHTSLTTPFSALVRPLRYMSR